MNNAENIRFFFVCALVYNLFMEPILEQMGHHENKKEPIILRYDGGMAVLPNPEHPNYCADVPLFREFLVWIISLNLFMVRSWMELDQVEKILY